MGKQYLINLNTYKFLKMKTFDNPTLYSKLLAIFPDKKCIDITFFSVVFLNNIRVFILMY